jgi:hypothetical protein
LDGGGEERKGVRGKLKGDGMGWVVGGGKRRDIKGLRRKMFAIVVRKVPWVDSFHTFAS